MHARPIYPHHMRKSNVGCLPWHHMWRNCTVSAMAHTDTHTWTHTHTQTHTQHINRHEDMRCGTGCNDTPHHLMVAPQMTTTQHHVHFMLQQTHPATQQIHHVSVVTRMVHVILSCRVASLYDPTCDHLTCMSDGNMRISSDMFTVARACEQCWLACCNHPV